MLDLTLFAPVDPVATTTSSVAYTIKEYWERSLLRDAEPNFVHAQAGDKYTIPEGLGDTIEWRKFSEIAIPADALTEGVTPDGSSVTITHIVGSVAQYGDYVPYTDRMSTEAYDNFKAEVSKKLGAQMGKKLNRIVRDELAGATNKIWPSTIAARSSLTSSSVLDVATIFKAVAVLRGQNAPTIGGKYLAFIHPYVANDLMMANLTAHGSWIDVNSYSNATKIFDGEIGELGGVRFVQSTECKIWNDDTCPSASTGYYSVFQTLVCGANAYGVIDLAGQGAQFIEKGLGETGLDPLNQRGYLGWKAMSGAKRLNELYMVSIETCSATMPKASAN